MEDSQQQKDIEVNQDVDTQEPISLEIPTKTPFQPRTTDPKVDIIPNVELGEDEQMQSQSLGDTEVFGE